LFDKKNSESLNFNLVESCRKMIAFDSSPHGSTVDLVAYLSEQAQILGLNVEEQQEIQNGVVQSNIIVRAQEKKNDLKDFLLQTHLDTIDPGHFQTWKKNHYNPFDAVIENGQIYGLGAVDVKLDFLCKLKALAYFKGQDFKSLQPVLVGTFGEETGMQGALKLIRKNKINARFALIGEPSNFQIINAAKGFATVEMRIPLTSEEIEYKKAKANSESTSTQTKIFSGKSAHSSTPHLGDNAAVKLLEYLAKMPDNVVIVDIDAGTRFNMIPNQAMVELDVAASFREPVIAKINSLYEATKVVQAEMIQTQDVEFMPQHSTLSIGIIRTFEDHILIGGSCRILPNVKQEQYEHWMKIISDACHAVGAEFRLQDYKRPFRTDHNSVLVKAAQAEFGKLGVESRCQTLASTNEASLFSRVGIECVCIGAGHREGNVHTGQEHANIEDLETIAIFYQKMIERFCL